MDQCMHCTVRGKLQECLATKCNQHESWMAGELRQIIVDIKNEVADKLPAEDENIQATPVERLSHSVYLIAMRGLVSSKESMRDSVPSGV